MNILDSILLKVKVQIIYYQTHKEELGKSYATSNKRITVSEAESILEDRDVQYKEVLKVKYEYIELDVPLNELENYII